MSIDKRWQLNRPYKEYANFEAKQIINTLSPEKQQELAELIQTKIFLQGKNIVNQELYEEFLKKLHTQDKDGK